LEYMIRSRDDRLQEAIFVLASVVGLKFKCNRPEGELAERGNLVMNGQFHALPAIGAILNAILSASVRSSKRFFWNAGSLNQFVWAVGQKEP
jgi:hypothetical protein